MVWLHLYNSAWVLLYTWRANTLHPLQIITHVGCLMLSPLAKLNDAGNCRELKELAVDEVSQECRATTLYFTLALKSRVGSKKCQSPLFHSSSFCLSLCPCWPI